MIDDPLKRRWRWTHTAGLLVVLAMFGLTLRSVLQKSVEREARREAEIHRLFSLQK